MQSKQNQSKTAQHTQLYRQHLLQLAAKSNTQTAWTVSQHVLDRLWDIQQQQQHQQHHQQLEQREKDDNTTVVYGCQQCGTILHPGYKGSTIRVKRPQTPTSSAAAGASLKTIRRRQQRKIQRAAQSKRQLMRAAAKSSSNSNSNIDRRSSDNCIEAVVVEERLVLLGDDDMSDHKRTESHLVLTCGRCHGKVCLNGIKRPSLTGNGSKPAAPERPDGLATTTKKRPASSATAAEGSSLELNFEPLPPSDNNKKWKAPNDQRQRLGGGATLIEQRLGPKKKKKKGKGQDSKLISFLSSLNDP
jgi:hypothetical protein